MKRELKQKWLEALRSGRYGQCRGHLHLQPNGYCCLGVLLDVSGAGEWRGTLEDSIAYVLPVDEGFDERSLEKELERPGRAVTGLTELHECDLIERNDSFEWNFNQIAEWIEDNVEET